MAASGSTPNSSATAYATGDDMVANRDWRQIADLLLDDNTRPVSSAAVVTTAASVGSPLYRALRWASGMIEAAVTTGQRYLPEDLIELTELQVTPAAQGGDGSATAYVVGRDLLVGLTCDLAFWWLCKRRKAGIKVEDVPGAWDALATLEQLRHGERIFPIAASQDAGLADTVATDSETSIACAAEPVSQRARRLFGDRR